MTYSPTIYLVPHTHYDAIWVFNKNDYYYINIELILKQAVDLIKKTNYKFLIEQTFLLEEIENNYPELFCDIQRLAKEGKIEIAGGQYLMSDVMLPHGEVLIMEIAEGKRYVKEKLHQDVVVAWGADEFGFNAQWPQILRGCGYKYFAFRRGMDKPKPSEFLWQGLDGSHILCHWMPLGYRAGLDLTKLEQSYEELKKYAASTKILMPSGSGVTLPQSETSEAISKWNGKKNQSTRLIMATAREFFEALESENIQFKVKTGEMYSGKLSEVFPDCTSSRMWIKQGTKEYENLLLILERWNAVCSLYLHDNDNDGDGHIANVGTYSSDSLSSSDRKSYPIKQFWRKLLFIAMHDALPGTGIDEVYKEIKEIFEDTKVAINQSIVDCLQRLSKTINSNYDFVVFNSLPWNVNDWAEIALEFQKGKVYSVSHIESPLAAKAKTSSSTSTTTTTTRITDEDETHNNLQTIPVEILDYSLYEDGSIKNIRIGFITTIPPLGFRTFNIVKGDKDEPIEVTEQKNNSNNASTTITSFNNGEFEIKVDSDNAVLTVSKGDKIYFTGNELLLEEELGDLYYHRANLGLLKSETGLGVKYGSFKAEKFDIKKGKVRSCITLSSKYYALRWPYRLTTKLKPMLYRHDYIDIKKEIIIYNQLPRIDFVTHIHDRHPHSRIRVKFDTSVSANTYWSGTQFGAIERKTNLFYLKNVSKWSEKPTGIFPSLEWIDYSDPVNHYGVSILHQGIPSHEIRDNSIYLTLLRSVMVLSADGIMGPCVPTPDAAETKPYSFKYSVLPHNNSWREAATYRRGMEVNMPFMSIQIKNDKAVPLITSDANTNSNTTTHYFDEKSQDYFSFFELEPENIVLSTLKLANGFKSIIIIRIYETQGKKKTVAKLKFGKMIKSAWYTDLLENEIKKVEKIGKDDIKIEMDAFKIVTLKIEF